MCVYLIILKLVIKESEKQSENLAAENLLELWKTENRIEEQKK